MHSSKRLIYFYDIEVGVNKEGAQPPPMRDVIEALAARLAAKKAVHAINRETAYLEIGEIQISDKHDYALLLVKISDTTAPNAYYSDPAKGTSRIVKKRDGEGRGFAAHVIISLEEVAGRPNTYLTLLEKNQGLHRSHVIRLLQAVLRGQYKEDDNPFQCPDVSGARGKDGQPKMIKFRPMLEFTGHPSETLLAELATGVLKGITILHSHPQQTVSGHPWLEQSEDLLRFKATSTKPIKNIWNEMKSFFAKQSTAGYEKARVRFKKPDKTTETIEFNTATGNVLDDRYVKSRLISDIKPPMDDGSDAIVPHFAVLIEKELLEHRKL